VRLVPGETEAGVDLDHVALVSPDPVRASAAYVQLGFERRSPSRVAVPGAYVELAAAVLAATERPLLDHLEVRVESAEAHRIEALAVGIEVDSTVDAANTRAVFVLGPDQVRIEYVEHKSTFSLV
jgi:catechol 2,3-dioxygenase-like lactoylglutathione lyase family enzyme